MSSLRATLVSSFILLLSAVQPAHGLADSASAEDAVTTVPATPSVAASEVPPLALTEPSALGEPKQGSLFAEIATASLGEVVGITITGAALARTFLCADCRISDEAAYGVALGTTLSVRPLIVGGFTGLGGRWSGGDGKSGMAMLGAVPGTLMIGLSWLSFEHEQMEAGGVLMAVGHVATIFGAVTAYRFSARSIYSERMARALRYAPSPMVDRQRRVGGLSLSGSF